VAGPEEQPELSFRANTDDGVPTIAMDEWKIYQRMEGGGAAFTDGAAWLVHQTVQRDHVMLRLFRPARRNWHQLFAYPISSSDLTRGWYTYDDNSSDRAVASLPHFSIDHDLADVLPLTKLARQLNLQLTLMIKCLEPARLDDVERIAGGRGSSARVLRAPCELSHEAHGLHVNYVSLNNEPTCCPSINYPSILLITSSQMATMLKDDWFPAFKANHLTTKILLLDFNWGNADLVEPL